MFNLSSAMAGAFAEAVNTMVKRAKELGPNPLYREGRTSEAQEREG